MMEGRSSKLTCCIRNELPDSDGRTGGGFSESQISLQLWTALDRGLIDRSCLSDDENPTVSWARRNKPLLSPSPPLKRPRRYRKLSVKRRKRCPRRTKMTMKIWKESLIRFR